MEDDSFDFLYKKVEKLYFEGKSEQALLACNDFLYSLDPDERKLNLILLKQEILNSLQKSSGLKKSELSQGYRNESKILLEEENYNEALDAIDIAISNEPENIENWKIKGDILVKLNDRSQARESYAKCLAFFSDDSDLWFEIGYALAELWENENAVKAYKKCLELHSRCSEAWNNLGLIYERHYHDIKKASEYYSRALAIIPEDLLYLINTTDIFTQLKDNEKAYSILLKSFENYKKSQESEDFRERLLKLFKNKWKQKIPLYFDGVHVHESVNCYHIIENDVEKYQLEILNWEKCCCDEFFIDTNEMECWRNETSGGDFWILQLKILNLCKKELIGRHFIKDVKIIDNEGFIFNAFDDTFLSNMEFKRKRGLLAIKSKIPPKISKVFSLLFLLPDDMTLQFFLTNDGENVSSTDL